MARRRSRNVQPGGMGDLGQAVRALERTQRRRDEEIYRAHLAGSSLRAIALETGLSHESVRVIVETIGKWVARERRVVELGAGPAAAFTIGQFEKLERKYERRREHLAWLLSVSESDS